MNILIVGSGAREHALAAALHRSPKRPKIFCCAVSMNPGIMQMAHQYWVCDITDVTAVSALAMQWKISLAIIGPEAPLEKGLADALWQNAVPTIGPKKKMAQIETSKAFARQLMESHDISGLPRFRAFESMNGVDEFLKELGDNNYVVKANGLMGGKGVKVAGDHLFSFEGAIAFCQEVLGKGQTFVIEEKLIGQEFSIMCFCDGEHIVPMPIVQDHKRAFVDDKGPNTGGMGSYSDVNHSLPFLEEWDVQKALEINDAVLCALTNEVKDKYIGILYGSFIATRQGVYVIEFNARFGDPEAMNVLSILDSDFVAICEAMVMGNLSADLVTFKHQATVCKYVVPNGSPDEPVERAPIDIAAVKNKACLYLSAVDQVDGKLLALGSRTAAYVGVGNSISEAEEISEKEVRGIGGDLFHREDIGTECLIQRRVDAMRKLRAP